MISQADIPPTAAIPAASPRDQAQFESDQHRRAAAIAAAKVPLLFLEDHTAPDGHGGWMKGEIAGFDPGVADHLERSGIATRDLGHRPPAEKPNPSGEVVNGTVAVHFKRAWKSYFPGDTAGFSAETARWLQVKGIADPVDMTPVRRTLASIRAAIFGG